MEKRFIKIGSRYYNVNQIRAFWLEPNPLGGQKTLVIEFMDGRKEKVLNLFDDITFAKLALSL